MATETSIQIGGMGCTGCVSRVRTVLTRLEGVIKADADQRAGRAAVRFDPGRVTEDCIRERIRAAGYDVA